MADDNDRLAHFVQDLPQELFDEIFDLATTITSTTINITEAYLPPKSLQIDIRSRGRLAKVYYETNTFAITDAAVCLQWLESLAPEHSRCIKRMQRDALTPWERDMNAYFPISVVKTLCYKLECVAWMLNSTFTVWIRQRPNGDNLHYSVVNDPGERAHGRRSLTATRVKAPTT
jgi:hypothetical protein